MSMLVFLLLLQPPAQLPDTAEQTPPAVEAVAPDAEPAPSDAPEVLHDAPSPWRAASLATAVSCATFGVLGVLVGSLLSCSNVLYCPLALGTSALAAWLSRWATSRWTRWRAPLLGTLLVSLVPTVSGCGLAVGAGILPLFAASEEFIERRPGGIVHLDETTVRAGYQSPRTWAWLLGGGAVVVMLALTGYLASSIGVGIWTALRGQAVDSGS